jgi:hypothetical protein
MRKVMKKDILTITTVALTTATLTVLAFWTAPLEADNEAKAPTVAQPKLVANGIEMTLVAAEGKTFEAGDKPQFQLTAKNITAEPATTKVAVSIASQDLRSMGGRTLSVPTRVWQQDSTLTLAPNEQKNITLSSDAQLPKDSMVSVAMQTQSADNSIVQRAVPQNSSRVTALAFSTSGAANASLAKAK